ncbi:hypothetical protein HELRODRAFT_162723 [Helobdella robusta]|uniref:E3 SUMO-protein ligase NSE2 n=1 Tax=Helobdella robusta TaxID=6412 RepID=T1ET19_HELRO|nr:hypothetical protein HELRODRAFT_162723 [Helobdella robusta]ESN99211.1 hypothetical protein HELRODRAFT_162723 [Helobdella robusta]
MEIGEITWFCYFTLRDALVWITLNEVQLKQEPNDGFNDDELIEIHSCNFNTADEISNVDNMPARASVVRGGDEDEENEEDDDSGVRSKVIVCLCLINVSYFQCNVLQVRRRPGILSRRGRKRKTADNNKMVGTSKNSASYEDGDCLQIHTSRSKKSKNDSSRAFNGNLDDVDSDSVHGVTRNDESVVDGDDNSEPNYSIVTSPSNCDNNNYSRADEERRSGNRNVAEEEEEEEEDDAETNDVSTNGGEETEDAFSNESDACDLEIVMPVESDSEVDYVKAAADQLLSLSEEARADVMVMGGRPQTKCPITQSTMIEPVRNKLCGHSYDRKGALQLINMRANKARCPVPGCANVEPLNEDQLEEDAQIKMLLNLS